MVECNGLENRQARKGLGGSNPSPSATNLLVDWIYMEDAYLWYQELIRPSWAPPAWLFGPVWSVLYTIILISFGAVLLLYIKKKISTSVSLPFALNLLFNLLFSPIQFQLQNNLLASVDILLVLGTLLWSIKAIYPIKKWIAYAQVPYLLWVTFATILQLTITYLNF